MQAHLGIHLSKCHIVGNHMSQLNYFVISIFRLRLSAVEDIFLTHNSWENIGGLFGKFLLNYLCAG